jgi:DNA-binding transcriptional LysR family regulator
MVLVPSPTYLATHGIPKQVQDLQNHTAVLSQKKFDHWIVGGETVRVRWRISTGSMVVTHTAVRDGLGIARMPGFLVAGDLADGGAAGSGCAAAVI